MATARYIFRRLVQPANNREVPSFFNYISRYNTDYAQKMNKQNDMKEEKIRTTNKFVFISKRETCQLQHQHPKPNTSVLLNISLTLFKVFDTF